MTSAPLTDFAPRWTSEGKGRRGMGISFDCPIHRDTHASHRIGVMFENPIDGGSPVNGPTLWRRTGATFETLDLSPSIHVIDDGATHWHGFVTTGMVRS